MGYREAAPDGTRGADGLPILVRPQASRIAKGFVLDYLACGGMSVAYRALGQDGQTYLAKEVASSDARGVMALSKEKGLLERLDHPGIVKVYDLFEDDDFFYLILQLIEGGTLDQQISPFDGLFLNEKVVSGWGVQLCEILDYLHTQQPPIIYKDLKPKNVMKDRSGKLVLIDFGIARLFKDGKNQDTDLLGSALTASPEHYGGQTDARSDVYSLGATLHYLLSNGGGERNNPFDFQPLRRLNPSVSQRMEDILGTCLQRDPKKRYQSVRELLNALQGTEEQNQVTVPLPNLQGAAPSTRTGRRGAALALAAALVCGGGLLVHRFTPPAASYSETEKADAMKAIRDLGPLQVPLRMKDPRFANLAEPETVEGPQDFFTIPVPKGWRVRRGQDGVRDIELISPASNGMRRIVSVRTIVGQKFSAAALFEARQEILSGRPNVTYLGARPIELGGQTVNALQLKVVNAPAMDNLVCGKEDLLYSHSGPDWTWVIEGLCEYKQFPEFQKEFEAMIPLWSIKQQ